MDGDSIFRKTTVGVASFAHTSVGLNQAQRGLLIMIDGKRTMTDLRKLATVFGDCDALVKQILEMGMIEPAPATVTDDVSVSASAATAAKALAKMTSDSQLATARTATAKYIADVMGPMGDKLGVAIERSKTLAELTQSIDTAAIVLEDLKGAASARELQTLFAARLL
jgi:hypothetical protein